MIHATASGKLHTSSSSVGDSYLEVVSECHRLGRVLLAQERSQMIDDQIRVVVRLDEPIEIVSIVFVGEQESQVGLLRQMIVAADDVRYRCNGYAVRHADLLCRHVLLERFGDEEVPIAAWGPRGVNRFDSRCEIDRRCEYQTQDARWGRQLWMASEEVLHLLNVDVIRACGSADIEHRDQCQARQSNTNGNEASLNDQASDMVCAGWRVANVSSRSTG